jgi:hypothetical protein
MKINGKVLCKMKIYQKNKNIKICFKKLLQCKTKQDTNKIFVKMEINKQLIYTLEVYKQN